MEGIFFVEGKACSLVVLEALIMDISSHFYLGLTIAVWGSPAPTERCGVQGAKEQETNQCWDLAALSKALGACCLARDASKARGLCTACQADSPSTAGLWWCAAARQSCLAVFSSHLVKCLKCLLIFLALNVIL